ncbi:extracellular solute-binding protein [Candidatus Solirubrobacter pratensis]|uniref:extracellular solute-binding protein n=1 Tax=Candidatus Solirubrobacter pratensis TaxID=1298857 RepID=UPI0004869325|nr:extracellular solute-binding protein [Candidatus Solirubrobacter pratensis]
MRRVATAAAALGCTAAVIVGCGGGGSKDSGNASSTGKAAQATPDKPVTLDVWVGWSARELKVFKSVAAEYTKLHPKVTVNVTGGINDNKIVAAIRAGNAPDVVSSFNSYNVGVYCGTGGWIDLNPLLKASGIGTDAFPAATNYYTQYDGKKCALPLLADTYGLYYNKTLFKKAGITDPPKTLSELTEDAKKLTIRNSDGTLKQIGIDPFIGFYENVPERWIQAYGGKYVDGQGHAILSKQQAWTKWLQWQKSLIDFYGYKNLVRFQSGLGDEFSASNAFEVGKVAMNLDGEWRVAFIQDEHPDLDYGTAPMAVDDATPDLYGSGYINGTIIGIPRNGKNTAAAWQLVKWLTTDTHALAMLSNGLRNVPSTTESTTSSELTPDEHFATFLKIFSNPKSGTSPIMASGVAYTNLVQAFATKWQGGGVGDLQGGLTALDKQLDAQVAQAKGAP